VVEINITRIRNSKSLIESQKNELNKFNQHLEKEVHERTSKLEEQNDKLKKHAFYNAHLLRGPFCRIQGLIQLEELVQNTDADKQEIRKRLQESINELDTRIKEIQEIVETKEMRDSSQVR
jgi:light-regulated signal transduction histidine kinase (bacteriophytochrome)